MNTSRFKKYVELLHKKEVRKNLIISGSIFTGLLFCFLLLLSLIKSGFEHDVQEFKSTVSIKMDSLANQREVQVNRLRAGITQDNVRRWHIMSVEKLIMYTQRNTPMKKKLKQEPRHNYATWIVDESDRHGLSIALVASVIAQESKFNSYAISEKDAHGLMQVIDETGQWLSKELGINYNTKTRLDPKMSIKMGTWYLKYLIDKYNNDIRRALGHYNGGQFQSRAVVLFSAYKNNKEFRRNKIDVYNEFNAFRQRIRNGDNLTEDELNRYKLLDNIRCAQNLNPETKKYVPEILAREKIFQKMMDDPSRIVVKSAVVTSDTIDEK